MSEFFRSLFLLLHRYLSGLVSNRQVILAIPSVAVMVALGAVLTAGAATSERIKVEYLKNAREAMATENIPLAKIYYGRLLEQGATIDPLDELNWAMILRRNGEETTSQRMLDRLAPDDSLGFAPAHRLKAFQIGAMLANSSDPKLLERLQWHLKYSGDESSFEVNQLWSMFYLRVGQPKPALARLSRAAEANPEYWYQVAGLATQLGEEKTLDTALFNAERYYLLMLEKNPFDFQHRILLSHIYLTRKNPEEAEKLLRQGLMIQDIPELHRAVADVLLYRFDRLEDQDQPDFTERHRLLSVAFRESPNYAEIYRRLLDMYGTLESDEQKEMMKKDLEELVAEGNSTPFAHFSLGSIEWVEGDAESALWHLEKAYLLDANLLEVGNNLAWVLASSEEPDLERANKLASSVVEKAPSQSRFRDTLAMILKKQERWDDALLEYERVLVQSSGEKKREIHGHLAELYDRLGRTSLGEMHRRRASEAVSETDELKFE